MEQPYIWKALSIFRFAACALPHGAAVALGGFIGGLIPFFTPKKYKEAAARCADVMEVTSGAARGIVRRSYSNFGRAAAEFARMPVMADRLDDIIRVHGEGNLKAALERGKGVVIATAHLGNWEYAAAWVARHGYQINGLGAEQRDERITALVAELRGAGGVKPLGKASDLKAMIKALQAGEIIAVPIDQDPKKKGILSPFLGRPASTPAGIAKLADKIGCAVLPAFCVRYPDGVTLDLYFLPAFEGRDGEPYGKDLQSSLDDCNAVISEWIRRYPDQWMWMYPRWESVERGEFDDVLRN